MVRRYATVEQLAAYPGGDQIAASDAEALLDDASADVDDMLFGAVYEVDDDGMPTAPEVAAVLARATLAQAVYLDELGDRTGAGRLWQSASIGGVSYTRARSTRSPTAPDYAPRALTILRTAGLISARVTSPRDQGGGWWCG